MTLLHKSDDSAVDVADKELELVPLALLAGELGEPIDELARRLGDDVVRDDLGLRAVPGDVATSAIVARDELVAEHRRTAERNEATTAAIADQHRSASGGVPAIEGLSAFETMMTNADDKELKSGRVSVHQEFLDGIGRPQ
jgi:hypothetical protein